MVGLFEANMSLACLLFVIEKKGLVDIYYFKQLEQVLRT